MKRYLWILFLAALLIPGCKKKSEGLVEVRWFVGLGTGSDQGQDVQQQKVVDAFNATHENIKIKLEIVDNENASETLATQLSAGNAPDIVGPVGGSGRNQFKGSWLDLSDLIDKNDVDLDAYEKSVVESLKLKDDGQIGLPFAVYPSFLIVNKDIFKEYKLPLPPQKFGEKYTTVDGKEVTWDYNALAELAKKMTVDKNGNLTGTEKFNAGKIAQFGYSPMYHIMKEACALFGAGAIVDANNQPTMPAHWRTAMKFWHDAMWKDVWVPNGIYEDSQMFPEQETFTTGLVAMAQTHLWYLSFADIEKFDWDLYATPSYNGKITTPFDFDSFVIPKASKHQEEAFVVYQYLINDALVDLTACYGGLPALASKQDASFKAMDERYPSHKITWQVVKDSMKYVDIPGYEGWEPNGTETGAKLETFWRYIKSTKDIDVDKEIDKLMAELKVIYAAEKK